MGRMIAKKVKGMNWKAKLSLILIFTLTFSTFMYQGFYQPKTVQAAVANSNAWVNIYSAAPGTASGTFTSTSTFTVGTDPQRLVLAAVCLEISTSAGTLTTMQLRLDNSTGAIFNTAASTQARSAREHCYMGWLNASQVSSGTHNLYVNWATSANTVAGIHAKAATFSGVDQTNPIYGSADNYAGGVTVTFGTAVNYITDGFTTYVAANGNTPATMTAPSGFTTVAGATNTTNSHSTFAANITTIPHSTTGSYAGTTSITFAGTTSNRSAAVVVSLKPFVSDLSAPTVTAFTATTPTNNLNIPITTFTATDNVGVTGYKITQSSTAPLAGDAGWVTPAPTTYTVASSGTYTLYPWAKDAVGNVSTVFGTPRTVVVDVTAPSYTWNSPASGAWFRDGGTISVDATITEAGVGITNGASCNAKIDGGTGSFSGTVTYSSVSGKCTGTLTLSTPSGLSEGLHDLTLQVADTAGNTQQSAARSIGLDNVAPAGLLSSSPADEATGQLLDVAVQSTTATDAGSGGVQYYFQVNDTETYDQNSGWIAGTSFAPPSLQYGTTYTWKVKARDAAGNETAYTTPRSFSTASQCFRNEPSLIPMGTTITTITTDGGTANYTIRVVNNDIGGCPSTTFSLTSSEISDDGDNFIDTPTLNGAGSPFSTNSLVPGGYQDITFGVTARAGKTAGRARDRVTSAADAYHPSIQSSAVTTNLNVAICTAYIPQLVIGPDAGNVAVGGSLTYSVSLKNTDVGAACTAVTYAVSIVSENPTNPDANFNASTLTYGAQNGTSVNVTLNKGQTDTLTLNVSSKAGAVTGQTRVTTVGASAAGHTAPPNATATTTIGNVLLHNSININSTKWSSFGGWGVPGGKYGEFICNTCHMLDGTTSNIKKVLPAIATPDEAKGLIPGDSVPIVFTRVTGNPGDSGVMGDDSSLLVTSPRTSTNRVCEICHTYDNTGVNGVKVHAFDSQAYTIDSDGVTAVSSDHKNYNAKDCVACHKHNIGFRPPTCTTCHANPPVNAGGLTVSPFPTGSTTAGAHAKHAATLGYSCSSCHNNHFMPQESGVTPNKGVISLGFNYQNYTTGTYSGQSNVQYSVNGGAEFTGDGNKNCSNVYCHSIGNLSNATGTGTVVTADGLDFRTIAWDGAAITCDKCHGNEAGKAHPVYTSGTAGSTTANSHVKHVEGSALSCDYCHNTTTTDLTIPPTTLVPAGAHLDRIETVSFKSNGGKTGTYDPTVGTGKTCSATYCHGNAASVQWGGSTTCVSCHGATNNGDLSSGTTGHQKHYQSSGAPSLLTDGNAHTTSAYVFACQNCHPTGSHATGPVNGTRDAEINGTKLTSGNYTAGGSWTTDARTFKYTVNGTCSTVCHTKDGVTLLSGIVARPAWNTTNALGCGYCHNKAGDASPTWSTVHTKHVNTYSANINMTCEACHTGTAASNGALQATVAARNQHPNQNRDVAIGTFAGGTWVTVTGAQGSQTCANTYCHSNGTSTTGSHAAVTWSGTVSCSACHRDNTTWTTTNSTGAHWTHVVSGGYTCNACHNATASNNTTITGFANHVNKSATINFSGAWSTTTSSYNGNTVGGASVYQKAVGIGAGTCNTTFCHGSVSRNWGTVRTDAQCVKCHGVAGTTTAQYGATPNTAAPGWNTTGVNTAQTVGTITNNVSSDQKVGAHDSHLRNIKGYSGPVVCTACHSVTAIGDAGHMDGASTMIWSSLARNRSLSTSWSTVPLAPAYSGGNCSVNYCHGYSAWTSVRGTGWTSNVSWTNSAYLNNLATAKNAADCNKCHASPPTASTKYDHSAVAMPLGLATNCAPCHNHEGSGASHINGILYGAGTCNTCHWYDTADAGAWSTNTLGNQGGVLWNSTNAWGAHAKHITHLKARYGVTLTAGSDLYGGTQFNRVCGFCHSNNTGDHMTVSTRQIIWNTTTHQFGASSLNWNTVSRSCSNLDCHYKASPVW